MKMNYPNYDLLMQNMNDDNGEVVMSMSGKMHSLQTHQPACSSIFLIALLMVHLYGYSGYDSHYG